jgi:addiction module RelE/StbE family toxin
VSYHIFWSESALERAEELFDFIAEESPDAARRITDDLFARVENLSEHPKLGRRLSADDDASLRRLVVGSFIVVYQIEARAQTITVVAVRHFRQRSLPGEEP